MEQRRGGLLGSEIFPWEWAVWITYWAPQAWNLTPGRWVLLDGLKNSEDNRKAERNLNSTHEKKDTCLLTPRNKVEREDWKCLLLLPFPAPTLHMPQLTLSTHFSSSCSNMIPSGVKVPLLWEGEYALRVMKNSDPTHGTSAPAPWDLILT